MVNTALMSHPYTPVLGFSNPSTSPLAWQGSLDSISFDLDGIQTKLLNLDQSCHVVRVQGQIGITHEGHGYPGNGKTSAELLMSAPPLALQQLGDRSFQATHGVKYAYAAGAMAGGIASEELVIALGRERVLSSFGTGGLSLAKIEAAINRIQHALPNGPYVFNLLHNPGDPTAERSTIDLYLNYGVRTVEASAFMNLTPNIVYYRVAGLRLNAANQIEIQNKVIAKLSRREVATKFLQPAPTKILKELVQRRLITDQQAALAETVPMADDITVEADSGGHTDNRPLVCLLPSIQQLRDEIQVQHRYQIPVRVGVAGGLGTPQSALAAFTMGAAYVVTGSINQSCLEASASQHTKQLLAQAEMHDVMMAPAADMFELGVKLQVLKRGTLFPLRAQKLFDLYKAYNSIEEIPVNEREKIETQIFRKPLDTVWHDTQTYLSQRNPSKLARAETNPKLKMALIFRWYLGLSSRWSNSGESGREMDYQIWCGPAMGAFNTWVKGSYLADPQNRTVVDVAHHMMIGTAFLHRIQHLSMQGLEIPASYRHYSPAPFS